MFPSEPVEYRECLVSTFGLRVWLSRGCTHALRLGCMGVARYRGASSLTSRLRQG